jgi:hypothetical protein
LHLSSFSLMSALNLWHTFPLTGTDRLCQEKPRKILSTTCRQPEVFLYCLPCDPVGLACPHINLPLRGCHISKAGCSKCRIRLHAANADHQLWLHHCAWLTATLDCVLLLDQPLRIFHPFSCHQRVHISSMAEPFKLATGYIPWRRIACAVGFLH